MPEYPEIISRAREMQQSLCGLSIQNINILQEKCLNLPEMDFIAKVTGQSFLDFSSHGKWIIATLSDDTLLLNLGMGGEVLHILQDAELPQKKRVILQLSDGSRLAINFWWFGYFHFVPGRSLNEHKMIASLGPDVMQISREDFTKMVSSSKQRIKTLLLDQKKIAGIGNFYIHDILFSAAIHPLKPAHQLTSDQIHTLYNCMRADLQNSADKSGAFYEQNLWGGKGNFAEEEIRIGYKEGKPCPVCQSEIKKISTGSNTSYICEICQPA